MHDMYLCKQIMVYILRQAILQRIFITSFSHIDKNSQLKGVTDCHIRSVTGKNKDV